MRCTARWACTAVPSWWSTSRTWRRREFDTRVLRAAGRGGWVAARGPRWLRVVATCGPWRLGGRVWWPFPARMRARDGAGCRAAACGGRMATRGGHSWPECVISEKCWSFCQRVRASVRFPAPFGAWQPGGQPTRTPSTRHFTRRVRNGRSRAAWGSIHSLAF